MEDSVKLCQVGIEHVSTRCWKKELGCEFGEDQKI
jgi:hypothetical protein